MHCASDLLELDLIGICNALGENRSSSTHDFGCTLSALRCNLDQSYDSMCGMMKNKCFETLVSFISNVQNSEYWTEALKTLWCLTCGDRCSVLFLPLVKRMTSCLIGILRTVPQSINVDEDPNTVELCNAIWKLLNNPKIVELVIEQAEEIGKLCATHIMNKNSIDNAVFTNCCQTMAQVCLQTNSETKQRMFVKNFMNRHLLNVIKKPENITYCEDISEVIFFLSLVLSRQIKTSNTTFNLKLVRVVCKLMDRFEDDEFMISECLNLINYVWGSLNGESIKTIFNSATFRVIENHMVAEGEIPTKDLVLLFTLWKSNECPGLNLEVPFEELVSDIIKKYESQEKKFSIDLFVFIKANSDRLVLVEWADWVIKQILWMHLDVMTGVF